MGLDPVLLSRLQFAITIGFHFLFPPLSIGLAWLLVIAEWRGWKRNDEDYIRLGKFFSKLLGLTFVMGVATGITMEFQFGTNWAEYSKFVGDIFGAPLAAEAIFAFFLESSFLAVYILGRNRVSKAMHWFSVLMVAVGATISAFWILVANSWQQTPSGFIIRNGRAELTNFFDAVFNASTGPRFFHTVDAALIAGAFFMAGVAGYLLLKNSENRMARKAMTLAVIFGLIVSCVELFPFGHFHARQVALTQPEKFAAIEGLYDGQTKAPMVVLGLSKTDLSQPGDPPAIRIPGLLSYFVYDDINAHVQGLNEFSPDELPPLALTFYSFHLMVLLGMGFIGFTLLGVILLLIKSMWKSKWYLILSLIAAPFPLIACQLGWISAEVGRQPWIVYKYLKTADAISTVVPAGQILFSIVLFSLIYLLLGYLYIFLLVREVKHEAQVINPREAIV